MGNDNNVSRDHRRCVEAHESSKDSMWMVCVYASRVVGKHKKGLTKNLAHDLTRSVSQVENYATAINFYKWMRSIGCRSEDTDEWRANVRWLQDCRRRLTMTHFYTLANAMRKYGMNFFTVKAYLDTCKRTGLSANGLYKQIEEDYEPDTPVTTWDTYLSGLRDRAVEMINTSGIPNKLAESTLRWLDETDGYLETVED